MILTQYHNTTVAHINTEKLKPKVKRVSVIPEIKPK